MSRFSQVLDATFLDRRVVPRLREQAGVPAGIHVVIADEPDSARDGSQRVRLRREGRTIIVGCDRRTITSLAGRRGFGHASFLRHRAAVLIRLMAEADPAIGGFTATISDFCPAGLAGFCSNAAGAILVLDADFFNSRGYAGTRALATLPWRERGDAIVWRGATTGIGAVTARDMSGRNPALIPRTRLCLILKDVPGTDAAFVKVRGSWNWAIDRARLWAAGLSGRRIGLSAWARLRFAIDVDGNTNAWSNLFNRLLLGCCVIKVGSERGFRQWYYDDLVPWRHYVPVKPDMSDLAEKIAWCRDHSDECEAIATAGRALAMSMTFERELARGVAAINRAFGGKGA